MRLRLRHPYREPAPPPAHRPARVRGPVVVLLFWVSVLGVVCAIAVPTTPPRPHLVELEPPLPVTPPAPLPAVDVVWSDDDPYVASVLLGVDLDRHQAVLVRNRLYKVERWMLDTIDLDKGALASLWEATPANAHAWVDLERRGAFHPITGTLQEDAARYATVLRATHGHEADDTFAASPEHVLYFTNTGHGFTTWIADEAGRSPRKLADTFASYPAFSPDGKWVTFLGCNARCAVDGYVVFVARAGGGPARALETSRVPGQRDAYGPYTMTWSPKGELIVLDWPNRYGSSAPDCVLRFRPDAPERPEVTVCMPGRRDAESGHEFLIGTGEDRVLAGWDRRGAPLHYAWLSLTDGAPKADGMLPADVTSLTPWARPHLDGKTPTIVAVADDPATHDEELVLLDAKDATKVKRLREGRWRTVAAQGMWWLDDDRLLALRALGSTTQLVTVHRDRLR